MDFKTWWEASEIFGGEGCMEAAEEAWDDQQDRIDKLKAELEGLKKQGAHFHVDLNGYTDYELPLCYATQPVQPAVPDGWQLVPKKLTSDMFYAMCGQGLVPRGCNPEKVYEAMLSAAPKEAG